MHRHPVSIVRSRYAGAPISALLAFSGALISAPLTFSGALLSALLAFAGAAHGQTAAPAPFQEELARQKNIYLDKEEEYVAGYVTDRGLADYRAALSADFDETLARLGPDDRWLDIGAGRGQAILDYYSRRYDAAHPATLATNKARAVAMSVEDRRTALWNEAAARLAPEQLRYVYSKTLREYSVDELGRFQIITDVIGGFSYTASLSLFMEKTLGFLATGGTFYTVLQDVRAEDGGNTPYYEGSPFLTQIRNAGGQDIGVCAWLKTIACVEVSCESRPDWKPPIQVYRVHKVCDAVSVPALETLKFTAGTPPERDFRVKAIAADKSRAEAALQ